MIQSDESGSAEYQQLIKSSKLFSTDKAAKQEMRSEA